MFIRTRTTDMYSKTSSNNKITAICQREKQAIYQITQLEIIVVFLFNSISMVNDNKKKRRRILVMSGYLVYVL